MRATALITLAALLLSGCFSYVPVRSAPPEQGTEVRVSLHRSRDVRLVDVTANEVNQLSGQLVRADQDTVALSATSLRSESGVRHPGLGLTVRIARDEIRSVERKRFDFLKSAGLALAVGAFIALVDQAAGSFGGGDDDDGGGPPVPR